MIFARFRQVGRAIEHAQRFRVIAGVLLKYGYDDLAHHLPLSRFWLWLRTRRFRRVQVEILQMSRPERLRRAFEELGPAFVKLGQLLASRTRVLPRAYTDELAKLHDQMPPVAFAEIEAVLAAELRGPPAERFAHIEPEPIGAASIAQVHAARLPDGSEVVVKIRRPDIEGVVRTDLEIMARIADTSNATSRSGSRTSLRRLSRNSRGGLSWNGISPPRLPRWNVSLGSSRRTRPCACRGSIARSRPVAF